MVWKTRASKEVYRNKWMWVVEDSVVTEVGKELTYGVVHKHPSALIIPWDGEFFSLVKQYRYPVESDSWEFPQGHYEHHSIEETARAELREETGLLAGSLKEIGSFWIDPGMTSQECNVFLATELVDGERDLEESEEGMIVKKFRRSDIQKMIASAEIKDGPTIAALAYLDKIPFVA